MVWPRTLSVVPEHQGQGAGSLLVREALRILHENAAAGCVLLGEPQYYGRFGFEADPRLTLPGVLADAFGPLF